MNKEIYIEMTNQVKEVLTNMPQNNKKNKQKYLISSICKRTTRHI